MAGSGPRIKEYIDMDTVEYGRENKDIVMLLHGGGLSWWNYKEVAELLCDRYRVILPILDGHGGSSRQFVSIEENAAALLEYIDTHHGGQVHLIGGLSLGGQILIEMLSRRPSVCDYAIIESANLRPSVLTGRLVKPMVDMSFGMIRRKWFAKIQFQYLKIKAELFADYYADTCKITKQDMTAFMKASVTYSCPDAIGQTTAKVSVVVGAKEQQGMIKSAEKLHKTIPESILLVKEDLYHGEFSLNHPQEYAEYIRSLD